MVVSLITKTAHAWPIYNARTSWLKKRSAFVLKKTLHGSCQYPYHAISSVNYTDNLISKQNGTTSYFWARGLPIQNIFPIFVSNIS